MLGKQWICSLFCFLCSTSVTGFQVGALRFKQGVFLARMSSPKNSLAKDENELRALIGARKRAASSGTSFSADEVEGVVHSLRQLSDPTEGLGSSDWEALSQLLGTGAHMPHKEWERTENSADQLLRILGGPEEASFRRIFSRVLKDGNWDGGATAAAASPASAKPWVVLVTGVNGIRKTSSVYQPWFKEVLGQALGSSFDGEVAELPAGDNSFFRQLDYMIATIANEEFRKLYEVEDIGLYAAVKDSIFARYRTLAEMLGVLLVKKAKAQKINVMVETSGRDIAMFKYVDHFFSDEEYRKLVVHFTINDITFAEKSVDGRMEREMAQGRAALSAPTPQMIAANAGGPYGSQVLREIERESNAVWQSVVSGESESAQSWLKASISIEASDSQPWQVRSGGGGGEDCFEFTPL